MTEQNYRNLYKAAGLSKLRKIMSGTAKTFPRLIKEIPISFLENAKFNSKNVNRLGNKIFQHSSKIPNSLKHYSDIIGNIYLNKLMKKKIIDIFK